MPPSHLRTRITSGRLRPRPRPRPRRLRRPLPLLPLPTPHSPLNGHGRTRKMATRGGVMNVATSSSDGFALGEAEPNGEDMALDMPDVTRHGPRGRANTRARQCRQTPSKGAPSAVVAYEPGWGRACV
jgi:hypothetical protein